MTIGASAPEQELTFQAVLRNGRSRYPRLLDADAAGIDWRITAQLVLSLDPAADLDGAQVVYEAHLARACCMTRVGYRLLLKQD